MKKLAIAICLAGLTSGARAQSADFKTAFDKDFWVRAYTGYDFALMGALNTGSKNYVNFLQQLSGGSTAVYGTAETGNSGLKAGLEFGFQMDKDNAFTISLENVWSQTFGWNEVSSGAVEQYDHFSPDLMSASLNYRRTLFRNSWGMTSVSLGGGYYHTVVSYSHNDPNLGPGGNYITADPSGDTLGGTLGLDEVVALGTSFGIELSVQGRLATFGQVTCPSFTQNGTKVTTNAPYALGIFTVPGYPGYLDFVSPSFVPNNFRYAVVDYSGFTSDLSFNFYF